MNISTQPISWQISRRKILLFGLVAVASFHLAYWQSALAWLMIVYLGCMTKLTRAETNRSAFCAGMLVGLAVFVPQMGFLWNIFKLAAIPLWIVLAFWHGLFLVLGRQCRLRFGPVASVLCLPFLWTGLEYFRSEVYFLRFSWFNAGFAFWEWPAVVSCLGGVYGVGFWLMTLSLLPKLYGKLAPAPRRIWSWGAAAALTALLASFEHRHKDSRILPVAGVQLEFPNQSQVIEALDKLILKRPESQLIVLSEYTFDGPVPDPVRAWCKRNNRWLIAGGEDELGGGKYYNTAFVIGTNGEIVFKQAKCMPIQFFKDGLPAPGQKLWDSPWGRIGICICYDLNYRRVTDELVRLGADMIIVPTMDVADWGLHQHQLHARVAPVRAAEYGVPIFRLCSSGLSQLVGSSGRVSVSGSFPGDGEMIAGTLGYPGPEDRSARIPSDSFVAPFSMTFTALLIVWFATSSVILRIRAPVAINNLQTAKP